MTSGDHLAGGVFAPCPAICCAPETVRVVARACLYNGLIVHTGIEFPDSFDTTWGGSTDPGAWPPSPEPDQAENYYSGYDAAWTGSLSSQWETIYEGTTISFQQDATLAAATTLTTPGVWRSIAGESQLDPFATYSNEWATERTTTRDGWTGSLPPDGASSLDLGLVLMDASPDQAEDFFEVEKWSGGTRVSYSGSWTMNGDFGTSRSYSARLEWGSDRSWDGSLSGSSTYTGKVEQADVAAAIATDLAAEPPWDGIDPETLSSSADFDALVMVEYPSHDGGPVPQRDYYGSPVGWPTRALAAGERQPGQGPGVSIYRRRHYLEFQGYGAAAVAVTWQSRVATAFSETWPTVGDVTAWGDWQPAESAVLRLHLVDIEGDTWLRSDPLPEPPLPEDLLPYHARQIRLVGISPAYAGEPQPSPASGGITLDAGPELGIVAATQTIL